MSIKQAKMPELKKNGGANINDVLAFIESGWDCAEVELGGRGISTAYMGVRKAISYHKVNGVRCVRRNGHIYLVRED